MTDLEHILPLWNELEASGADYVLATVVAVEGSSYRRPGARMLLAQDGRRAGTVSGGCLEAEVAKRAWWLSQDGPVVERYSTLEDDGDLPYGSGCGGVVYILLERRKTASPLLHALKSAFDVRKPSGHRRGSRRTAHGASERLRRCGLQLEVQRAIQSVTYCFRSWPRKRWNVGRRSNKKYRSMERRLAPGWIIVPRARASGSSAPGTMPGRWFAWLANWAGSSPWPTGVRTLRRKAGSPQQMKFGH